MARVIGYAFGKNQNVVNIGGAKRVEKRKQNVVNIALVSGIYVGKHRQGRQCTIIYRGQGPLYILGARNQYIIEPYHTLDGDLLVTQLLPTSNLAYFITLVYNPL